MEEKTIVTTHKYHFVPWVVLLVIAILVWAFLFVHARPHKDYTGYYIYCINAAETKVTYEKYAPKNKKGETLIKELLHNLQKEPSDVSMKKAIPDNVSVDDFVIDNNGDLTLYLDAAYGNYSGVNEILRRAAIVKTLCQSKDVRAVQFYVAGQPLTDSNMNSIGYMTAGSFIDNTDSGSTYRQTATVNMYFASRKGDKLVEVPVEITYDATIPLEQLVIEQLLKGPSTIDGVSSKDIQATIPKDTILNKVTMKEHTCYVDFSEQFLNKPDGITAEVAIYSVVNTLIELPDITKVQFSINGKQELFYNDSMPFEDVFTRNLDLVQ